MNVGESQSFAYTGGIQTFTVPYGGLYKLEVWGASGGGGAGGGYSIGYIKLKKNTILYIVNGGAGTTLEGSGTTFGGGYNGGGNGRTNLDESGGTQRVGSGGGCTHIALVSGTLSSIGKEQFVTSNKGLIVAGGGGGGSNQSSGGNGGGLTGGSGQHGTAGGSQTRGANFGSGSFGNCGGGGGFYGGYGSGPWTGAGGGSGWIDGVPEITYKGVTYSPSTTNGVNGGNGKATITFIAKGFPTIHAFGKDIVGGYAYGKEISDIKAFGKDLA